VTAAVGHSDRSRRALYGEARQRQYQEGKSSQKKRDKGNLATENCRCSIARASPKIGFAPAIGNSRGLESEEREAREPAFSELD